MHDGNVSIRIRKYTYTHTYTHAMSYIAVSDRDEIRGLDEGGRVVSGETLSDMAALG